MKGTIIGSDILQYGSDLKIIEINTNTTILNEAAELLDYDALFQTLTTNEINELHFIYTKDSSYSPVNDEFYGFEEKLKEKCVENGISYFPYIVPRSSVTVPYIEDTPNKFILRQAYDVTALVDESYCANKFGFLDLMSGSSYIPKTFFNDLELGMDTIDTIDLSNPNQPNYVIKAKLPDYDAAVFPELYELSTQSDLDSIKDNLSDSYLLQEFIYDEQNIINNRYSVIRSIDIIYGSDLDVINMGGYRTSTLVPMDFTENEFVDGTNKYNRKTRHKYINKKLYNQSEGVHYHTDSDSMILACDGTLTDINSIQLGDCIKSINFLDYNGNNGGNFEETIMETLGWSGSLEQSIQSLTNTTSSLNQISSASLDTLFVKITLENGTSWDDTAETVYYIEESGSLATRFDVVNNLYVGDKLIVNNRDTNTLEAIEITELEMIWKEQTIYGLDFEPSDLFLVDIGNNLFTIMHNSCDSCGWSPCGGWGCAWWCSACNDQQVPNKL